MGVVNKIKCKCIKLLNSAFKYWYGIYSDVKIMISVCIIKLILDNLLSMQPNCGLFPCQPNAMFPQFSIRPTLMDYLNCILLQLSQLEALLKQSMANMGSFKNLSVVLRGCKEKFSMLDMAKERIVYDYEKGNIY